VRIIAATASLIGPKLAHQSDADKPHRVVRQIRRVDILRGNLARERDPWREKVTPAMV
jgi:hypothetical protein